MGQKERDRLKVLHEAERKQITQKQASEQLGVTERQVRRLLRGVREQGDRAVLHGLRGRRSNRCIDREQEQRAIAELRREECHDFGPLYAAEHVAKTCGIQVGRDTMRGWMVRAGLWQPQTRKAQTVRQWRPRRPCAGELVQWDTSVHPWLEGRGPRLYLIAMIDDATSRVWARFAAQDTSRENMRVLWGYLERYGRPLEFYTDKAGMFEAANQTESGVPRTQIERALGELGIRRTSAHSPQAKGRIERFFGTAQDRLLKGMRLAGADTLEAANRYLDEHFLPDWNRRWTQRPANATDAHRPLLPSHDLAAILSHVEVRKIGNDLTFSFRGERYQVAARCARVGMKTEPAQVRLRLDGSLVVLWRGELLEVSPCGSPATIAPQPPTRPGRKDHNRGGRSRWMKNFSVAHPCPTDSAGQHP